MGCQLSASFKKDEVRPISYTPRNAGDHYQPDKTLLTNGYLHKQDATPREIIPNREKFSAREVTPAKEVHPTRGVTSAKEVHPTREVTPAKEVHPTRGVTPAKENGSVREVIPAKREDSKATSNGDVSAALLGELEIVQVADGEGTPITLGKLFGTWTAPMPSLPAQIVRAQHFTFHDSDVVLLGYAKSGSHWLWEMIHMMLKGRPEYCRTPKERLMLSFSTQEFFDTLEPPRVFNCHAPWSGLPPALKKGQSKCRMIYVLRNPKDVAVSLYHQMKAMTIFNYEGTFHGFVDLFLEGKVPGGSWFDYVLDWEETVKNNPHLPLLVVHYEDIKKDTVGVLERVNAFLGLGCGESLLVDIADRCTISKMKEVDSSLKDHVRNHPANLSKTGQGFIYRKGQVGDWKNHFSEADNERFERVINTKLKNSSLAFTYEEGS